LKVLDALVTLASALDDVHTRADVKDGNQGA